MNLAFKIVSKFPSVSKVEDLVRETHAYFSRSPKRYLEFQQFADGITDGKKLLKDVDTRWISLNGPTQRLFNEFKYLVGLMYENHYTVDKAQDLLSRLTNIETLFTLAGIQMVGPLSLFIDSRFPLLFTTRCKDICLVSCQSGELTIKALFLVYLC